MRNDTQCNSQFVVWIETNVPKYCQFPWNSTRNPQLAPHACSFGHHTESWNRTGWGRKRRVRSYRSVLRRVSRMCFSVYFQKSKSAINLELWITCSTLPIRSCSSWRNKQKGPSCLWGKSRTLWKQTPSPFLHVSARVKVRELGDGEGLTLADVESESAL